MKIPLTALLAFTLAACTPPARHDTQASAGMANPASVACGKQGGQLDLRKDDAGNVTGFCQLPDGRTCEEWALYRDHQCLAPPAKH